MTNLPKKTLRIGLIGSGFIAKFHLEALKKVRNVEVVGVYSPTQENRDRFATLVSDYELGDCASYGTLEYLVTAPNIDALWMLMPNNYRLEAMREIHDLVVAGKSNLLAIACEKPLARTLKEAREMLRLAESAKLNHGYLENQVFATPVIRGKEIIWRRAAAATGRPYLARAAEEHSGPHEAWFWDGQRQGGGVLLDMMCHSIEVARYLLTDPKAKRSSLKVKNVNGSIATLKWSNPKYADQLSKRYPNEIDYKTKPSEDFARGIVTYEDEEGNELMVESTTSWAYVGAGLRINLELLGPEYSMEFNSLNTGLKIFMSREVEGQEGEDLVEKQNAEQGLMPVLEDEAGVYGYVEENIHMVECFRKGITPIETFVDGVEVTKILMALYRSAELGTNISLPCSELEDYIPTVARH